MASLISIERDFKSVLDEHIKLTVVSGFLPNGEVTYRGKNIQTVVEKAAMAWRQQCLEQCQVLESQLKNYYV